VGDWGSCGAVVDNFYLECLVIDFEHCFTGRRWINIGSGFFAIGFGPKHFIERIYWRKKLVYWSKK